MAHPDTELERSRKHNHIRPHVLCLPWSISGQKEASQWMLLLGVLCKTCSQRQPFILPAGGKSAEFSSFVAKWLPSVSSSRPEAMTIAASATATAITATAASPQLLWLARLSLEGHEQAEERDDSSARYEDESYQMALSQRHLRPSASIPTVPRRCTLTSSGSGAGCVAICVRAGNSV